MYPTIADWVIKCQILSDSLKNWAATQYLFVLTAVEAKTIPKSLGTLKLLRKVELAVFMGFFSL